MKPFYAVQAARFAALAEAQTCSLESLPAVVLQLQLLASHLKLRVADGLRFVTASSGQVWAPRDVVWWRGGTWQDPASTSPHALENKSRVSFTEEHSPCQKCHSCRTQPSTFLTLPWPRERDSPCPWQSGTMEEL